MGFETITKQIFFLIIWKQNNNTYLLLFFWGHRRMFHFSISGRVTKRYGGSSEEVIEKLGPRNGRVQERSQVDIEAAASKPREDLRVLRRAGREDVDIRVLTKQEPRLFHIR